MIVLDKEGKIILTNDYFEKLLNYNKKELIGRTLKSLTYAEDYKENENLFEKLKSGEIKQYSLNKRFITKDYGFIWVKVTASSLRGENNEINFVIKLIEDITELRKKSLLIEAIIENGIDTHLFWDENQVCIDILPYHEEDENIFNDLKNKTFQDWNVIKNNKINQELIYKQKSLFNKVKENENFAHSDVFKIVNTNGKEIIMEVVTTRFNSNKFYQVYRDITGVEEQRNKIFKLLSMVENFNSSFSRLAIATEKITNQK